METLKLDKIIFVLQNKNQLEQIINFTGFNN